MAWPTVELRDVLKLSLDPIPVDPNSCYPNIGIYSFARGIFPKSPISGQKTRAKTLYRARAGQFIYSRLFAFEGAYAVVPIEFDGVFVSNEFPTFEADPDRLLVSYLLWMFARPDLWRDIAVGSKGMGGRRQRIHPDTLLGYRICLPPLDEQRRLLVRLDRVAALVEERRQVLADAPRDVEVLLRQAFERAIKGAHYLPLERVAPLVRRAVDVEPDQVYTEIGVKSFYRGLFHRRAMPGSEFSWQKLFSVHEGDLIFSNLMAWEQAIGLASSNDHECVGNHRMLTCEVNRRLAIPDFLMAYFQTNEGFRRVLNLSPGTIARNKTLSSKLLPTIEVPVPPLERQRWFVTIQAKVLELRRTRAETATDVDALIPAMLHEVFGGAIKRSVPQLASSRVGDSEPEAVAAAG